MILPGEIVEIGRIAKPHGVRGELSATVYPSVEISALRCLVVEMEGIFVPFFIGAFRRRGNRGVLLSIDGIPDETGAACLTGKTIYALKDDPALTGDGDDEAPDDGMVYLRDLIGYGIIDRSGCAIGEITDIEDSTDNILFVLRRTDGRQLLVPAAEDLIVGIDPRAGTVTMTLPEGLLSL